jgi:hypothetical protein
MLLAAGDRRDALHEIEYRLGWPPLLPEHGLNDAYRLQLREAALAQEFRAVVVRAGNDALAGGLDAGDEGRRARVGKLSSAGAASWAKRAAAYLL